MMYTSLFDSMPYPDYERLLSGYKPQKGRSFLSNANTDTIHIPSCFIHEITINGNMSYIKVELFDDPPSQHWFTGLSKHIGEQMATRLAVPTLTVYRPNYDSSRHVLKLKIKQQINMSDMNIGDCVSVTLRLGCAWNCSGKYGISFEIRSIQPSAAVVSAV